MNLIKSSWLVSSNFKIFQVSYYCLYVITLNASAVVIVTHLCVKPFLQSHHHFIYISSYLCWCWWSCIFCFNVYCNILIAFCRSSSKRYLQYFYQQFWISHRDYHGKCYNALGKRKTWLNYAMNTTCQIFYCSTCRASCKCYLQHIYQQLWVNSRNYNGEWGWALKPSCEGMGYGTKNTVVYLCDTNWVPMSNFLTPKVQ